MPSSKYYKEHIEEILEHFYFHLSKKMRKHNKKFFPLKYMDRCFDIDVEVNINTVNSDVRNEDDDYNHALRYAALALYYESDHVLSSKFHKHYLEYLFEQEKYFKEVDMYTYPYEVYEKGEGSLKNYISTTLTSRSFFSYQFLIGSLLAKRYQSDLYFASEGKILIEEKQHLSFLESLEQEKAYLEKIYFAYYEKVLTPILELGDTLLYYYEHSHENLFYPYMKLSEEAKKIGDLYISYTSDSFIRKWIRSYVDGQEIVFQLDKNLYFQNNGL